MDGDLVFFLLIKQTSIYIYIYTHFIDIYSYSYIISILLHIPYLINFFHLLDLLFDLFSWKLLAVTQVKVDKLWRQLRELWALGSDDFSLDSLKTCLTTGDRRT